MNKHILHMDNAADVWENASPIGCGSMGAMLFGGTDAEKIYLSEETIWSGEKNETAKADFRDKVKTAREMYLKTGAAGLDEWAKQAMADDVSCIKSFEYAGILSIDYEDKTKATDYKRDIILDDGIADISYIKGKNRITEEAFASYNQEVIAIKLSSSEKQNFSLGFEREFTDSVAFEDGIFLITAHTEFGNHGFAVGIKIKTDGKTDYHSQRVNITGSENTVLFISVSTQFNFGNAYKTTCLDILSETDNYDELLLLHAEDFSALMNRSDIYFEHDEENDSLSVAQRLKKLKDCTEYDDFGLYSLYFTFGKYLMLSSSREDTLPANLQGVWAEKLHNPWNADYHTNINLQMNYWLCETANLSVCHMQLFDYMNKYLLPSGRHTAEINYGTRGTVLHHLSDIYGFTTPADGLWGIWPMGAAWLSYHMWEHYLFSGDKEFLRDTAYEYIRDCALFFIDNMFEDNNGRLLSGPSMSPENEYYVDTPEGKQKAYLCFSPAMDTEMISGLLKFYIQTEEILGISPETAFEAKNALEKMPELKIGKYGQLQEWLEDYDEPEPGHRHISHAFGLYPAAQITRATPELYKAIKVSIERRLSFGGGHTGWSRAWLINLFARLHEGEKAYENIRLLMTKSTLDNLFDTHPPFQIDGNFGGAAGIAETLLQSHEGFISILPAATEKLSGSFSNLMARGNTEVSAKLKNGKVISFTLHSFTSQTVYIELPGSVDISKIHGDLPVRTNKDGHFEIKLHSDKLYTFTITE